jgi:hypothetical protein
LSFVRRQTEILEATISGRAPKLDPAHLPLCFISPDASADGGERAVTLDIDRVVMARRISDVAMKIALPLSSYRGVAIRLVPGMTEDEDRVAVVLSHVDAALEVPLYAADDDENVIAEWRLWASTLGLPLLMEGMDGHTVAAENRLGEIEVDRPRARRRHSLLSGRRPRFLTRRRTGKLPLVPFVHRDEREIISGE